MTTDMASAERQREYQRWVIRREAIEECVGVLEDNFWDASDATIIAMVTAMRALKEV